MKTRALLTAAVLCLAGPALAQSEKGAATKGATKEKGAAAVKGATARAELKNQKGEPVGEVTFTQTPHGALVKGTLSNIPEGVHAIHIHETGQCEPPFKSAGGHFNPMKKQHGILSPKGKHAGDLPNLHAGADGKLQFEYFAQQLTVKSMADKDGSAVVVHASADDYKTDPAGDAGDRIACGVVQVQQ